MKATAIYGDRECHDCARRRRVCRADDERAVLGASVPIDREGGSGRIEQPFLYGEDYKGKELRR